MDASILDKETPEPDRKMTAQTIDYFPKCLCLSGGLGSWDNDF